MEGYIFHLFLFGRCDIAFITHPSPHKTEKGVAGGIVKLGPCSNQSCLQQRIKWKRALSEGSTETEGLWLGNRRKDRGTRVHHRRDHRSERQAQGKDCDNSTRDGVVEITTQKLDDAKIKVVCATIFCPSVCMHYDPVANYMITSIFFHRTLTSYSALDFSVLWISSSSIVHFSSLFSVALFLHTIQTLLWRQNCSFPQELF